MAEAVDGSAWGFNQLEFNELLASVRGFEKEDFDDRKDFALSKTESLERFGPAISEEAIDQAIRERVPEKTRKTTAWAMSVFRTWFKTRGVAGSVDELSEDGLAELLPRFIMEARRQDQNPYPPRTVMQLVAGIQRSFRETSLPGLSIFGDKDARFARTRSALDAQMKRLTREGIGTETKQAQPLSPDQEDELWKRGIFSLNSGWGLTNAVFWYNCKLFGLRGGDEHRNLMREQLEVDHDKQGRFLRFKGRNSKNVQGGLKHRKVEFKDLKIYARPELGERCVVDLYNHYFGFVPQSGPFYRKPVGDNPPKFSKQVIGKNKLSTLVKEMCTQAGFSGNYTNHSGKVTCATQLFAHNVDEQLIMRQTGHRSSAVRSYKRPGASHDEVVSSILQPPPAKQKAQSSSECWQPPLRKGKENLQPPNQAQTGTLQPQSQCWNPSPPPSFRTGAQPPSFPLPSTGGIVLNFNFGNYH